MGTPDTWYAYFHVSGSFDPDEITQDLGVTPTETAREGGVGRYSKKRPCSLWALHSRLERNAPLEDQVKDVLDQLDANKPAFEKLSRDLGGTMQLVGYFQECSPGLGLDVEIVRRMASYELTLDCDFYCVNIRRERKSPPSRQIGGIIGPY